jgi:hypothetical protein
VEYRIRWGEHAGRIKCGVVKSDGGIETKEGLYFSNIRSWVRSGPFHCPQGNEGCRDSQNTSPSRIASMVEVRQRESFMLVLNGCRPLGYVIHVCAREILAILYLLTQCSARLASQHTFSCTRSKLKFRGQAAQEYRRKKRAAEEPFQILSSTAAAATTNCSNSATLQDESVHSGSSFVGATTSDPASKSPQVYLCVCVCHPFGSLSSISVSLSAVNKTQTKLSQQNSGNWLNKPGLLPHSLPHTRKSTQTDTKTDAD